MPEQTHIETDRLLLRPPYGDDAPAIAQATHETWDALSQWMRWATDYDSLTSVENCRLYAQCCENAFYKDEDYTFAGILRDTGDFALIVRLAHMANEPGAYQFGGFWCRKSQQGKGLTVEAVNAVKDFAYCRLNAHYLQVTCAAGNTASARAIEKTGFVYDDLRKEAHRLPNDHYVDEYVYSLSCRDK